MKGDPVPDVPRSSGQVTRVEVEIKPSSLRDDIIRGTVEGLSNASVDYCPGHWLGMVCVPLGHSWNQEDQDDQ